MQRNKTDANNAHGLAQIVRTGWFREVAIKSMDAQALRMSLMSRARLVSQRQAFADNIRCLLKTFGFTVARKLVVIMRRVWKDDCDFNWGDAPAAA